MKKVFIHEDYYNSKGDKIPSVTTILKIMNKPSLMQWAHSLGRFNKSMEEVTYKAATIGTLTHYVLEKYGKKKIINFSVLDDYDYKIVNSVYKALKGFKRWNKEYKPDIIHCEIKVNNELFGGTVDNISMINDKKYLIDYKTSKAVYPTMFLQLAAYNYLLRTEKDMVIDRVAILLLNKNKVEYKFYEMDVKYLEKFYEPVFLTMYEFYNKWNDNLKSDWNTEL